MFADCGIDLDIISNEDIGKLRSGEVYNEECNELAVKMTLELINFCTNMATIRESAMESELKYLMTNIKHHKLNTSFRKSSTFWLSDNNDKDDYEPSKKMMKTEICDPSVSGANNEITSQITIDTGFDLDDFFISHNGVTNIDRQLIRFSSPKENGY